MNARVALHGSDDAIRLAMVRAFESAPAKWQVSLWNGRDEFDVLVSDSKQKEDAIHFDPADPDASVAAVEASVAGSDLRVTVVTGARRGTGVTTVALHLAAALADVREVCVVDLDPSSSIRARLDLPSDARHWGEKDVDRASAALPVSAGFRVLLAPLDRRGDAVEVLRDAARRFDRVVVDAPASPWRASALAMAADSILVIPPSRQGIAHGRDVLASNPEIPWSCVVNRAGAGGELDARRVASELAHPVVMELPCSPFLRDREDDGRLLTERWSRFFRRISRLAGALK